MAPSFEFEEGPYSWAWVRDFAAGIASSVRKDGEVPHEGVSEARSRGERMGWQLRVYADRWGIQVTDLYSLCIEWRRLDGIITRSYFNEHRHESND